MSTELTKPQNFEEIVRDRVRTVIMNAVPDEQIDLLIKKEFDKFFTHKEYNHSNTQFGTMVNTAIQAAMSTKIKAYVEKSLDTTWNEQNMGQSVSEELVAKLAPVALQAVAANIVSIALNNFRNNLRI